MLEHNTRPLLSCATILGDSKLHERTGPGTMTDKQRCTTLYEPLPKELGGRNARAISASVSRLLPFATAAPFPPEHELNAAIRNKTLLLHGRTQNGPKQTTPDSKPIRKLTTRNGKIHLRGMPSKYVTYDGLQSLWQSYARKIFRTSGQALGDRILRMDWHGAFVKIVRSKDPGLVGAAGVLIAETANTIVLVSSKNKTITAPKNVSIMQFQVDNNTIELNLSALCFRASERSARKIKKRHKSYF